MPGQRAAITEAARAAAHDRRRLLRVSHPDTWLAAGVPFLVAALDAERGLSPPIVLGLIWFLGPYGLLRGGLLDIHRPGADPLRAEAVTTRLAIAAANLPFLVVLVLAGGSAAAVVLLAVVALAIADAAPPLRLRDRPGLDLATGGALLALPAVGGSLMGGAAVAAVPWTAMAALFAWGVATCALGAIVDAADGAPDPTDGVLRGTTGTVRAIGWVPTAVVALAADVVVVLLVASLGHLGRLGAVGVALFALLPLMVVAVGLARRRAVAVPAGVTVPGPPVEPGIPASSGQATPAAAGPPTARGPAIAASLAVVAAAAAASSTARTAAAARRAWTDLTGLLALVGVWLAVLLAQHWAITTYAPWAVTIAVPFALVGYALANVLAIRIATRRRRISRTVADRVVESAPPLTIVVPTRDDVAALPACLAGLRAQTYPDTTILVVDDASLDGSREAAATWVGNEAVIAAPPRPAGWTSRAWACRTGADVATTELILFVDPDTVLAPIAARVLVEQLVNRHGELLVGLSRAAMPTPGERAAVPGFALLRFGFTPIWLLALTGGRPAALAVDAGPLLLVQREAYLAVGGHGPGRRAGARLTRAFAKADRSADIVRVVSLAATRRYHDVNEAVMGWRRRLLPAARDQLAGAIAVTVVMAIAFLVPMLLPPAALLTHAAPDVVALSFFPLIVLLTMRIVLAIVDRQSPRSVAWHPVTILLTLAGQLAAIADHVAGAGLEALTVAPATTPTPSVTATGRRPPRHARDRPDGASPAGS